MDANEKLELWEIFKSFGKDGLVMSHYDLAEKTGFGAEQWKEFLMEQDVSDFVQSEIELIQDSELRKIVNDISKSTSVGQAQLMGALLKLKDDKTIKDGPVFIYSHVPLNKEQERNASEPQTHDIFMRENNNANN